MTMAGDDDCLQISMDDSQILGTIFSLSLAMALVKSLDAYLIPSSRALHLKSGAAELESIIWLYRAPAGIRVPFLFDVWVCPVAGGLSDSLVLMPRLARSMAGTRRH